MAKEFLNTPTTTQSMQVIERLREHEGSPRHTLSADASFSTIGVICCRIILCTYAQRVREHVVELFHFALNPTGYLFLCDDDANLENDGLFEAASGAIAPLFPESSQQR